MSLEVRFSERDFTTPLAFPDVEFEVERYSWHAMGGPEQARIRAYGSQLALWELMEWLRAPVELANEHGDLRWWGYLDEVTVRVGGIEVGLSLKHMANRNAVAFSLVAPGSATAGTRATTAWAEDADSVARYGTKELLSSLSQATTEVAVAARDRILAMRRYPIPVIRVRPRASGLSATLDCRGWWDTLGWEYYAQPAGLESHTAGSNQQTVGDAAGTQQAAQSLSLGANTSWEAFSVWLKIAKVGTPADTVYADLYSDSGGAPDSLLATGSVSGATLTESLEWVEFELDTQVTVTYGTTYWIVVRRSDAVDADNHYKVSVDEDLGYPRGAFLLWNGSSWGARTPDADMAFKLTGEWETTRQITEALTSDAQFVTGVDLIDASGVWSSQYRDGDQTTLQVVKELLEAGTTNGLRLLATVTRDREVKVYEEPAASSAADATLFLLLDGQVEREWGLQVTEECPVGEWAALKDVLPSTVDLGVSGDPTFFVERSEFTPEDQTLVLEPRGVPSAWDMADIEEG